MRKTYTKKQISEAISYWKKVLNEAEAADIPDSEWKKMSEYIKKGSDFTKVGAACRSNELKQKCRYLILKALGLDDAADDFMKGLSKYLDYGRQRELEALQADGIEVPGKYQELAVGKDEMQKQYAANKLRFDKAHAAGPLKALAQIGIDYFTLFSDGSGHPQLKEKAKKYFPEGVPTYRPSYGWVGNSGLRYDADMIVIMENGKLKGTGKRYFGFVAHTLESDAPNPGYSVFSYNGGGTVFADSMCNSVAECMRWIKDNVEKADDIVDERDLREDEEIPEVSSVKEFLGICKKRGIEAQKKRVAKQGKVISAKIAGKDMVIMSREGKEMARKGSLVVDDGDNTFYAVQPEDISKHYEVNVDGSSATGDNTKWKKIGKTLDYYVTPFDVDIKVSWQDEPLHATAGYSIVCNDKDGRDLSPVAPEVFKDKTLWKPLGESKTYSRRQIEESVKHWKRVLESL